MKWSAVSKKKNLSWHSMYFKSLAYVTRSLSLPHWELDFRFSLELMRFWWKLICARKGKPYLSVVQTIAFADEEKAYRRKSWCWEFRVCRGVLCRDNIPAVSAVEGKWDIYIYRYKRERQRRRRRRRRRKRAFAYRFLYLYCFCSSNETCVSSHLYSAFVIVWSFYFVLLRNISSSLTLFLLTWYENLSHPLLHGIRDLWLFVFKYFLCFSLVFL